MKFKNEYVKIKTNKEVIMHNYIYDSYLELFSKSQYETDEQKISEMNHQKQFYSCFIKIEEKIKDVKNATKNEFDLAIYDPIINVNGNSNSVTTIYNYAVCFDCRFALAKASPRQTKQAANNTSIPIYLHSEPSEL